MRAFASLAVLMAGAVVQRANAQADYGTHNGNNNGGPDGDFGGNSGGSPSNSVNGDPNGISYGNPSGLPNGAPAGLPGNSPGSAPDMPTCALQGVTTVFVTVYPTSHVTPSGFAPSGAAQSNGFDPNQTIQQSALPASTVLISPVQSAQAAHTSVKPFTTVTIDVWGSDGDPSNPFTSVSSPAPISTEGASDPVQTSTGFPDGSSALPQDPGSFNSNLGELSTPSSGQATAGNGPIPGSFPTATPENEAYGSAGGLNSIPNTFNQQPSEYSSPTATVAGLDGSQPAQITVVGPDGKPTIVQFPGTQIGNGNGADQPLSTAASFPSFTPGASVASDVLATARETLCTSYTILGPNGIPTVVHSTWVDLPTTAASLPSSFPSGLSPNPSVVTGLPEGPVIPTHTTFTILGPDGLPTVVESSWLMPAPTNTPAGIPGPTSVNGFPNQVTGTAAGVEQSGSTTCTSYTVLGLDGLPTVVDTTWVIPSPTNNAIPSAIITGIPTQAGGVSGSTPQITTDLGVNAITTCTSYTVLGADGAPTIVESTFVIPASNVLPTVASGMPLPPAQTAGFPEGISNLPEASNLATTCITVGVVGPNGFTTPVVQTVLIPTGGLSNALPAQTSVGFPSLVPAQIGLPQGGLSITPGSGLFTTCITVTTVGPDGMATPVVQTVVGLPSGAELGTALSPLSTGVPSFPNPNFSSGTLLGLPTLSQYGTLGTGLPNLLPPSAVVSGIVEPTGTVTGTRTSTLTVINGPNGQLPSLVSYGDESDNQAPEYGLPGSSRLATALQTSTWTNVIPEQTTTYTINFPLTTMATVTLPNLRVFRRQQDSVSSGIAWGNNTLSVSPTSVLSSQSDLSPALPSATPLPVDPSPMCPTGGKIGNLTLDFDDVKAGPLFNPARDIWFSEGFLIAPPSSQTSQSYIPSSGGQLVEFVPPSLPSLGRSNVGDTAEIGVGPNAPNHCFRFDFQGASLGCAADGAEKWCEFEVSAYRYNELLGREESIAWSETKRIPACPGFPNGNCRLTPVSFDGYTNITSVLITLRVGTELRVWWGDDFKFGWNDNSCEAASCRVGAAPQPVKRETIESVARRGVWHWTARGLRRLDDEYIWESV
ncbi:hypothetical protein ACHAPE_009398 [Trichoderma viride]